MTEKIAFIGLGAMGLPMATNLVRKGFAVTAHDVDAGKMAAFAASGAATAPSIAAAARDASIVITMLPATPHVESVILGPGGVLENIAPGAIVMEMSTIDPSGTDRLAAACAARGVGFADTPVGRLVLHAERGQSLFMVGAPDDIFARLEPLMLAMGDTIYRCGPPGMGARMKVVNNYMLLVTAQVVAESLVLGSKLGLDLDIMKRVTGGTTATNGQFQVAFANKVLKGDVVPGFTIDLAFKDISLAITAAAEQRIGLPVGAAAWAAYNAARATDFARQDYSAMLDFAAGLACIPRLRLSL